MENIIYFLYKAIVTINRNTERTKEVLNAAKPFSHGFKDIVTYC